MLARSHRAAVSDRPCGDWKEFCGDHLRIPRIVGGRVLRRLSGRLSGRHRLDRDSDADRAGDDLGGAVDDHPKSESDSAVTEARVKGGGAVRWTLVTCTAAAAALGGVIGYFAYQTHAIRETAQRDDMFVEAGRQAALNLTTISYTDVDRDVARVLDSATGAFHDDFQSRSEPFIAVVKHARSTSRGTITQAGLSSVDGDQAQVIVAVSVTTSIDGQSNDQQPRGWRMRLNVQKVGDSAKVSDVQFVP